MHTRTSLCLLFLFQPFQHIALAGTEKDVITPAPTPSRWRVGGGYAQMLGIKAEFGGLGTFAKPTPQQPLGGGRNYNYDDGFVHLDSSGNQGGETWNWGYDNASQYDASGTGSMNFSRTTSDADASADEREASPGFEIFAYYDMGKVEWTPLKSLNATWGFRGGLHYTKIGIDNNSLLQTNLTRTIDNFDLGGIVPPGAPYTGSFSGPGPLISDSPTRTVTSGGTGTVSGERELDVHLAITNIGSYLSFPVTAQFDVMVEAGVSLGFGSGSYEFDSTTQITGLGSQTSSGKESKSRLLAGMYAGINANYRINEQWAIQGSARYQFLDSFGFEANGSKANLSFDSAIVIGIGGIYSF